LNIIAINGGEELLERFSFGFHGRHFIAALGEHLANLYDLTLPGPPKEKQLRLTYRGDVC
jgi:hypothetical protein